MRTATGHMHMSASTNMANATEADSSTKNTASSKANKVETVRDRLWIWSHYEGSYNNAWGLTKISSIDPVAGAKYMGIPNIILIRYDAKPERPFANYAARFKSTKQLSWSISGTGAGVPTCDEEREEIYQLAAAMPNMTGVFMDDFFAIPAGSTSAPNKKTEWLAENRKDWPKSLTVILPAPVKADTLELVQSDRTDYRSKDFTVDLSPDGTQWQQNIAKGSMPNESAGSLKIKLPDANFKALRINILSTYDTDWEKQSMSCGLSRIKLWTWDKEFVLGEARAEASSCFGSGFEAGNVLNDDVNLATISLKDLRTVRMRLNNIADRRLDLAVTLYDHQLFPEIKPYLELCDVISFWTWCAKDLENLEKNILKVEQLAPGKRIFLGLYMWDFGWIAPMSLENMKKQCELGLKWLKEERIEGLIFLGTNICDMKLETVEWSKKWIEGVADQPLQEK